MKKSYSYQRFSSIKQQTGDSLRRQTAAVQSFCQQFKLHLVDIFRDEGISAKGGKNWSHGSALNAFLKLVDSGTIEKGSVLIVESMDRLDRRQIIPCMEAFFGIIRRGVSVGCVSQNKIFDEDSINNNPMELMLVLVEYSRAGNENLLKSTRAKGIITSRIERAKKGENVYFGVNAPTWIIGARDEKFVLNDDKVKLVKEIFSRYLAGHSATRIANDMNKDKVPTLKRRGAMWNMSTILTLLKNRNVLGWCKIEQQELKNEKLVTVNSFEMDDYYPQILSDKMFQLTQQRLAFNSKDCGGSKYGLVRNLFKGLLVCPRCNEAIETKNTSHKLKNGTMSHYGHYRCRGVKSENGCTNKGTIDVSKFEINFFDFVFMAKVHQLSPAKQDNVKLQSLENELAKVDMKIDRLVKLLETDELADMAELSKSLGKLKKERETIKKNIESEKSNTVTINNASTVAKSLLELKRKETLGETITDVEERAKARNLMPSLYRKITLKFGKSEAKAEFYGVDGTTDTMTIKK